MHSSVCSYGYFCLITAGSFCFQYITLDFALSSNLRGQLIANCLDRFMLMMINDERRILKTNDANYKKPIYIILIRTANTGLLS